MKKALIFDLDRVLFNTDFLKRIDKGYKKGEPFCLKIVKRINWTEIEPQDLVYKDVYPKLNGWLKKGNKIYLFSQGDIRGQRYKLKASGLNKFFSSKNSYIFSPPKAKKLKNIFQKIPPDLEIWYFDDKLENLKTAKSINGTIKTVLVWRNKKKDEKNHLENILFKPDLIITSFREINKL
ncbi:hypothetical protein COT75_02745 [Candidatus Beckwithbacteria bacterium CG10_big_fil_rev_8_21_14_0_10_34_10]|uniref:FCP1 homology domain-containing protein n=1 Tax=Candidatus Beckwithbacteria bacterium CG10_big_fil_rev_8_21_14_0_10_34_10 TaxID=1974495 RepID=A0A2H0W903_9BACT|nr:MAG: hypothetical protein COT75_02745 [Candidatus Beckwithbacteria bacterium CG10_big_fil_rev_8_21_14_0_10_34_10]